MNTQIEPQRIIAQIDDSLIAEFISYWLMFDKPCPLTITPSDKSPGLVGIGFTVSDYKTMEFMERAVSKTGAKLWNMTKK